MALKKKVGKKKTSKKAPRKVVVMKRFDKKTITKKRISKFAATRRTKKSNGKPTGFEGFRSEMRNRPELIEKVHKVGAVFLVKALGVRRQNILDLGLPELREALGHRVVL